uniref:Gustatory receptor n=1 Tax=Tetranychus urticae TaxID=32264 RepID=T1KHQ5_TETUR
MNSISSSSAFSPSANSRIKLLIKVLAYFIGYPTKDEPISSTIKHLEYFERLTIFFRVLRFGFRQTKPVETLNFPIKTSSTLDYNNILMRICYSLNLVRLFIITYTNNETLQIHLGDIVYRSKDRFQLNILLTSSMLILAVAREWALALESKGKMSSLNYYDYIRINGFKADYLNMTQHQTNAFRTTVHITAIFFSRVVVSTGPFVCIAYYSVCFTNPYYYKYYYLTITCSIWSVIICYSFITLLAQIFGFAGYLFIMTMIYLHQLESLIEVSQFVRYSGQDQHIQQFIRKTIICLNNSETNSNKMKYFIFYAFTVCAFFGDLFTFYGLIINFYSEMLATLYATMGTLIFMLLGMVCFVANGFINKIEKVYANCHGICKSNKLSIATYLKIFEFMDRSVVPINGVKIGDVTVIQKTFFVKFIMEIASSLMLITINLRQYFE